MFKNKFFLVILIGFATFFFLPFFYYDRYLIRVLTLLFMWISLSEAWNISSGYTGYIDFGPVVYFGIGAYTTAILMTKFKISFFIAFIFGGFISGIIAVIIGIPTLRLKGAYFAIATFAFAESMKQIILSFDRTFNVNFFYGSHGITLPICTNYKLFYFLMLSVTILLFLTTSLLENSNFGLALKAIRDSEQASELIGIDTKKVKLSAYLISAIYIGIVGGIYSYWVTYITPDDVFSVHKSVQMVIMTLLGGMGSIYGPVVGATLLSIIFEILGAEFIEDYLILVGIILICIILITPSGIMGLKRWKYFLKQED